MKYILLSAMLALSAVGVAGLTSATCQGALVASACVLDSYSYSGSCGTGCTYSGSYDSVASANGGACLADCVFAGAYAQGYQSSYNDQNYGYGFSSAGDSVGAYACEFGVVNDCANANANQNNGNYNSGGYSENYYGTSVCAGNYAAGTVCFEQFGYSDNFGNGYCVDEIFTYGALVGYNFIPIDNCSAGPLPQAPPL